MQKYTLLFELTRMMAVFRLAIRNYHPSCHCNLAVNDERVDIHTCREVAGIDGDVSLAALGDGKALYLLAAHVVDEDAGCLCFATDALTSLPDSLTIPFYVQPAPRPAWEAAAAEVKDGGVKSFIFQS